MISLEPYFFKSLPDVFYLQDSNKDENFQGTLERMLKAYQEETESYLVDIEGLYDIVDPTITDSKFLQLIAGLFGYPPYPFDYEEWYRKVLDSIISINRWKGTAEGLRRWFALWQCTVEITITLLPQLKYNSGIKYNEPDLYYRGGCALCVYWTINVVDPNGNISELGTSPYSDTIKTAIQSILDYLIPINLILTSFSYNGVEYDIDLGDDNIIRIKGEGDDKVLATQEDEPIQIDTDQILTIKG